MPHLAASTNLPTFRKNLLLPYSIVVETANPDTTLEAIFPGVKQLGPKTDHSDPLYALVNN
jgi:hypothetical protein